MKTKGTKKLFAQDGFVLSMYLNNNLTESKQIPSTLVKYITKKREKCTWTKMEGSTQ